jgi:hypothetical protein
MYPEIFCYMSEGSFFILQNMFITWHWLITELYMNYTALHCKSSHQINILVLYIGIFWYYVSNYN